jgi:NACHT domain
MIPVEEVITGLLVGAIAALGRQARTAFTPITGRRQRDDLDAAIFFNSYELLDRAFPAPPPGVDENELMAHLRGNEVQALIQELLAVRLSDGPELTVERLKEQFVRICATPYAEQLFDEIDTQACHLTVHISTAQPQVLQQIREEAHFTRLNATVEAIQRHLAALQAPYDPRADQEFLESYRRHVIDHHGMIEPPDFARRRRVPIADLYVQPNIVETIPSGLSSRAQARRRSVDLFQSNEIDRTVLLGNPGGGKTTASHVLLHHYANHLELRVPFMVILRDFATDDPPQWSVVEFIEHRLRTFYQCPSPAKAIDRLLLNGGAFIVFDGLDELIDTTRRAEISAIIEQFCVEYPLTQILVTSRIVGYDEARLDERQFTIFRIENFDDNRVSDYVNKWFLQEAGISHDEAAALASSLLDESSNIHDLRSNPLMLALICILYRGERSIPQSRADVYEKCADLLFRRWDARRKIYVELRARHLIEPALRYLAYWMLTRGPAQANVTRRQLISETAAYFQNRGFDELHDAEAAAEEFVDFCRGRAWVFTDVGSTASGEQLYTFTHRTFMEYFAAYYFASIHDVPEALARALAPRVARGEWDMVGQLAVQMKDRSIERGGERILIELLGEKRKRTVENRLNVLAFLGRCLAAVQPRPSIVRELATKILDIYRQRTVRFAPSGSDPLQALLENWQDSIEPVASVLSARISGLLSTEGERERTYALELACCLPVLLSERASARQMWAEFAAANEGYQKLSSASFRGSPSNCLV